MAEVIIVGDSNFGRPFARLVKADTARLVREPANDFDRHPVAVRLRVKRLFGVSLVMVGYLSEYRAAQVFRRIDSLGGECDVPFHQRDGRGFVTIPDEWLKRR